MSYTLTRKPKSSIEILFSIPWEELGPHIERSAKEIGKELKVDGFRAGKVPPAVIRQKLSDFEILQKRLEEVIASLYYEVVNAEQLLTLGRPEISILKLADHNPFEFQATAALVPKVTPANFRELSVESKSTNVTEQEVSDALEELRRMRATSQKQNHEITKSQQDDNQQGTINREQKNNETMVLPELNDEFAKSIGKFENLEELKKTLFENLKAEKEYEESVRLENAIIDLLVAKSEFEELPEILLESELENVLHEFEHNIEHRGVKFSDWLSQTNKTEAEWKESLRPQAVKRAKSSLLLRTIAEAEKIEPTEEEAREEITTLFRQYPDASQQENLLKPEFTDYFRRVLISKKTLKLLKEIMVKK